MKISRKGIKITGLIAVIVLVIGLLYMMNYLKSVKDYQTEVNSITVSDVNIKSVADGTYIGECDVHFIYAKVEVTVQNGKIDNISILEHRNERGQAAEEIVNSIIDKQTVDVDSITSATNSSKVIKKAVENALLSGIK